MSNEFQWTADLLAEFIKDNLSAAKHVPINELMEQFKASKQPKNEWELIYVDNNNRIKSVKRRSDGSLWSIGDKFRGNAGCDLTIKSFEVDGQGMKVWSVEYGYWLLNSIKKAPLFTTEDGKDVYDGDKVALLSTDNWLISHPVTAPQSPFKGDHKQFKYFSTKEKAEDWLLWNKPVLTLNDVKKCSPYTTDDNPHYLKIIQIAKDKLNLK